MLKLRKSNSFMRRVSGDNQVASSTLRARMSPLGQRPARGRKNPRKAGRATLVHVIGSDSSNGPSIFCARAPAWIVRLSACDIRAVVQTAQACLMKLDDLLERKTVSFSALLDKAHNSLVSDCGRFRLTPHFASHPLGQF